MAAVVSTSVAEAPDRGARTHLPFALVVNPSSALGRGSRVASRVSRALSRAGVPSITIAAPSAAECQLQVARAAEGGLRGLILVGGDGLVGAVIQVPAARALPIGLVPAGSGNDLARQFSLSSRPRRAVRRALAAEHKPRSVDLGVVGRAGKPDHWFAGGLSIGFDAAINRRANAIRLPLGPVRYLIGLVAEIATLKMRRFKVTSVQGAGAGAAGAGAPCHDREFAGILCTITNIRTLGGGIPISPRSDASDGMLELIEVSEATKPRLASVMGTLARGKHEALPEVTMTSLSSANIDAGDEIAYADGDLVGSGPFAVRVAPGALTLLA